VKNLAEEVDSLISHPCLYDKTMDALSDDVRLKWGMTLDLQLFNQLARPLKEHLETHLTNSE